MTLEQLRAKVRAWDLQYSGNTEPSKYGMILQQLDHHAIREWRVYLPAENPDFCSSYMERLAAWVGNVTSDDEQKLLLEYALFITFFSHDDFAALYRTAMDREILRWVAGIINARLEQQGGQAFHDLVRREVDQKTWFCPITDSMDINEFYKVNHLKGIGHRPGFATLEMLAEMPGAECPNIGQNLRNYMARQGLERIVLLEDLVGSGDQCLPALRWALRELKTPVLFIPLIVCPNGIEALLEEELNWNGQLTVRPVIQLQRGDLLGPERAGSQGWPITTSIEIFATQHAGRLKAHVNEFGYQSTGCSIATFANTPDNTIPLVHQKTPNRGWDPLFPRVYRD